MQWRNTVVSSTSQTLSPRTTPFSPYGVLVCVCVMTVLCVLLQRLATMFVTVGMCEQAVKAYTKVYILYHTCMYIMHNLHGENAGEYDR